MSQSKKLTNNIDEYRKKRKKQKWVKAVLITAVAACILLLGLFGYRWLSSNQNLDDGFSGGFPILLKGDTIYGYDTMGSHLALLTDKQFCVYAKTGAQVRNESHSYFNPAMDATDERAVIFDIGGTQFNVETTNSTAYEKTTDQKIIFGKMAQNGNVAIVTEDDRYQCRLTIYDKKGEETFRWFSAEGIITALDFTGSGGGCVLTALNAENGFTKTTLYGLDFSKTEELYHSDISGAMAVAVSQVENRIHVVGDEQLFVYDSKGNQVTTVPYTGHLKEFVTNSDKYTVLLMGEDVKSTNTILILDANGQTVGQQDLDETVRQISSDGQSVTVLTKEQILCYSMTMKSGAVYDNKSGITYIAGNGVNGYEINANQIDKFLME